VKQLYGFTLLELLMVLAIIGLGSALLIPRLNSDVKLFDAQVRELVANLKYGRRMAVIKNQIQQVVLHPSIQFQATSIEKSPPKTNKKKGHWFSQGAEYIWTKGNTQNEIKNKKIVIDFFPQGGATEGELLIYAGAIKSKIIIDGFTGKVTLKNIDKND
jgi:prepilin-type N-terminal cleavage/methylation domain-containing protein